MRCSLPQNIGGGTFESTTKPEPVARTAIQQQHIITHMTLNGNE
jgi:hypothetical protein